MNNYKERERLFKEWTRIQDYLKNYEDNLSFDEARKLKMQENDYYKQWLKLKLLDKLSEKIKKGN